MSSSTSLTFWHLTLLPISSRKPSKSASVAIPGSFWSNCSEQSGSYDDSFVEPFHLFLNKWWTRSKCRSHVVLLPGRVDEIDETWRSAAIGLFPTQFLLQTKMWLRRVRILLFWMGISRINTEKAVPLFDDHAIDKPHPSSANHCGKILVAVKVDLQK